MGASQVQLESLGCWQCGYELHGLPIDGQCPECGLHLAVSRAEQREHALAREESKINWLNALCVLILFVSLWFGTEQGCSTCPRQCQYTDFSTIVNFATAIGAWAIFFLHGDRRTGSRILPGICVIATTISVVVMLAESFWFIQ